MAPSSAKRRSARKREATTRQAAANSSATNSPSRPPKRRKTGSKSSAAAAAAAPQDSEQHEARQDRSEDETSEDEAEGAMSEAADRVTEVLEEAREPRNLPNVTREHHNESKSDADSAIPAYAKLAGRTWTYFFKEPAVNIGRCPDVKHGSDVGGGAGDAAGSEHPHIDMAPNKHVSRLHARVFYNSADGQWHLEVNGRNGVRVNDAMVRKEQNEILSSGDVLKVDETEMIFVLPGVPSAVQQKYLDRLSRPAQSVEQAAGSSSSMPHAHPLAQSFQTAGAYVSPYASAPAANGYHEPSETGSMVAQGQVTPARGSQPPHAASSAQKATPHRGGDQLDQQIDYSDDSMRSIKPPMSYATLIAQAILAGPGEKSSLNGIYEWIKSNFAYYRYLEAGWQNSIRHNLSLNQAFQRVGRDTHEPGKGGLWYIVDDKIEEYRKQGLKMTSRGGARQASNPASPVPKRSPKKKTPPRKAAQQAGSSSQAPQHKAAGPLDASASVPSGSAPNPRSKTPPRGAAAAVMGLGVQPLPQLSSDASPLPARSGAAYLTQTAATSAPAEGTSPPAQFFAGSDAFGGSIFTPAPQRHEPRMTAPSTAKLPSKYLPQSSPAPFWKSAGGAPMLGLSSDAPQPTDSPVKHDPDATRLLGLQSSSPPPPSANGSPTRARAWGDAWRVGGVATGLGGGQGGSGGGDDEEAGDESTQVKAEEDESEDEQLDLMGNFPGIGQASKNAA